MAVLLVSACDINLHAPPGAITASRPKMIFKQMITKKSLTHVTVKTTPQNNNDESKHPTSTDLCSEDVQNWPGRGIPHCELFVMTTKSFEASPCTPLPLRTGVIKEVPYNKQDMKWNENLLKEVRQ
jgi:hypothetical protein